MTREEMLDKSLESLRVIAKAQGVKSITKYRKAELVDIIMNGGVTETKKRGRPPLPSPNEKKEAAQAGRADAEQTGAGEEAPAPLDALQRMRPDMAPIEKTAQAGQETRSGYTLGYTARPQQQQTFSRQPNYRSD